MRRPWTYDMRSEKGPSISFQRILRNQFSPVQMPWTKGEERKACGNRAQKPGGSSKRWSSKPANLAGHWTGSNDSCDYSPSATDGAGSSRLPTAVDTGPLRAAFTCASAALNTGAIACLSFAKVISGSGCTTSVTRWVHVLVIMPISTALPFRQTTLSGTRCSLRAARNAGAMSAAPAHMPELFALAGILRKPCLATGPRAVLLKAGALCGLTFAEYLLKQWKTSPFTDTLRPLFGGAA